MKCPLSVFGIFFILTLSSQRQLTFFARWQSSSHCLLQIGLLRSRNSPEVIKALWETLSDRRGRRDQSQRGDARAPHYHQIPKCSHYHTTNSAPLAGPSVGKLWTPLRAGSGPRRTNTQAHTQHKHTRERDERGERAREKKRVSETKAAALMPLSFRLRCVGPPVPARVSCTLNAARQISNTPLIL